MTQKNLKWFDNVEHRVPPWPGLNWLTAVLYVKDVKEAAHFYETIFNIVPIFEFSNDNGDCVFVRMRYHGNNFCLNKDDGFFAEGIDVKSNKQNMVMYIYVDNAEEIFKKALTAGCRSIVEPKIEPWGDKRGRILDPFGYLWDFATRVQE